MNQREEIAIKISKLNMPCKNTFGCGKYLLMIADWHLSEIQKAKREFTKQLNHTIDNFVCMDAEDCPVRVKSKAKTANTTKEGRE